MIEELDSKDSVGIYGNRKIHRRSKQDIPNHFVCGG